MNKKEIIFNRINKNFRYVIIFALLIIYFILDWLFTFLNIISILNVKFYLIKFLIKEYTFLYNVYVFLIKLQIKFYFLCNFNYILANIFLYFLIENFIFFNIPTNILLTIIIIFYYIFFLSYLKLLTQLEKFYCFNFILLTTLKFKYYDYFNYLFNLLKFHLEDYYKLIKLYYINWFIFFWNKPFPTYNFKFLLGIIHHLLYFKLYQNLFIYTFKFFNFFLKSFTLLFLFYIFSNNNNLYWEILILLTIYIFFYPKDFPLIPLIILYISFIIFFPFFSEEFIFFNFILINFLYKKLKYFLKYFFIKYACFHNYQILFKLFQYMILMILLGHILLYFSHYIFFQNIIISFLLFFYQFTIKLIQELNIYHKRIFFFKILKKNIKKKISLFKFNKLLWIHSYLILIYLILSNSNIPNISSTISFIINLYFFIKYDITIL